MSIIVKQYRSSLSNNFIFFQTFHQLISNFIAFNPHHTLFDAAITEEVNAAVPNDFLVYNSEFLVDVWFENQMNTCGFNLCGGFFPGG
jgi:hypothetical protein